MQTFFNPTTPFFDSEGKLLVNARVSFLDLETSSSLIEITDNDGTALPNPLFTGSDGRIRMENGNGAPVVPCVADGLSYKVSVAMRTGVDPVVIGGILQNPEELYEDPYIEFVVTAAGSTAMAPNTSVVGSIADVRLADKGLSTVICIGYYSAGDCPARVFTWHNSVNPPSDNGINILRAPNDNTGYWKMEEPSSGMWDVRMAGILTSRTAAQNAQQLTALANLVNGGTDTTVTTVYFPAGNWILDSGLLFNSLVVERGANFKPVDNRFDLNVVVEKYFENRGGKFCAYSDHASAKRVILATKGLLRSSWLDGSINEFLTVQALANVDEIIFDTIKADGVADVEISGKRIIQKTALPDGITFDKCERFKATDGTLEADIMRFVEKMVMGKDYVTEFVNDNNGGKNHVKFSDQDIIVIGWTLVEVLKSLKIKDFKLNSDTEGWAVWNNGGDWNNLLYLLASKAAIYDLRVNTVESNVSANFKKGASQQYDWAEIKQNVAAVSDADFATGQNGLVISNLDSNSFLGNGYIANLIDITAAPTAGRKIKFVCNLIDNDYVLDKPCTNISVNSVYKAQIVAGASIWFVADGTNWNQDFTRM